MEQQEKIVDRSNEREFWRDIGSNYITCRKVVEKLQRIDFFHPNYYNVNYSLAYEKAGVCIDKNIFPWGYVPNEVDYANIKAISFSPSNKEILDIPAYLKHLTNCECLRIPYPWFAKLQSDDLPASLQSIIVVGCYGYPGDNNIKYKIDVPEVCHLKLPNLVCLEFDYIAASRSENLFDISPDNFPALKYLSVFGKHIDIVKRFNTLSYLTVNQLRSFDMFSAINSNIIGIEFHDLKKAIPSHLLKTLTSLEHFHIHNATAVDFNDLKELPDLKEITLYYVKKLKNINSILECNKLKYLLMQYSDTPIPYNVAKQMNEKIPNEFWLAGNGDE